MLTVANDPTALDAKPTRRRAAKSPKPQAADRSKVSLYLNARTAKLLSVHATMEDRSMSDVVEALIAQHCKRWVVSDRARNADQGDVSQDGVSAD